jgi:hypothetical protein
MTRTQAAIAVHCLAAMVACCIPFRAAIASSHAQTSAISTMRGCCGFGWSVAALRDVDGDGVVEVLVGAPAQGHAYLYSGRTGNLLRDLSLTQSALPANVGHGHAVADAGDVDADGTTDLLIGAPNATGVRNAGTVEVYSGRTGMKLLAVEGPIRGAFFGISVAGMGDVNGDGRSDLLVGAGHGLGRVYLLSGAEGTVLRTLAATDSLGFGASVAS